MVGFQVALLALVASSAARPLSPDGSSGAGSGSPFQLDSEAALTGEVAADDQQVGGYQHQELNPGDGSYKFGYETENGSFRVEQRLGSGQLRGVSGRRAEDGTVVDAFRYSYDGYGYKQEPYSPEEQVPEFLRSAAGPEALPQLVHELQLFPEFFN